MLRTGDMTLLPCVPSLLAIGDSRQWDSGSAARPPSPTPRGSPVTWKGHTMEDVSAMGHKPNAAPGVSPELDCSCPALPRSRLSAAVGRSSSAGLVPAPAGFKSQLGDPAAQPSDSSMMPGEHTLLLLLLVLFVELLPTLAQQHHTGKQGTVPAVTPAPQRAPRRHWPSAILPAPRKAGECPAVGSGSPHPPRLYCISDHGCPGAEKCCQSGQIRTCLLPTTESPGYCPRAGSLGGESCGKSCHNDTSCSPGEKCCTHDCCARCMRAEPAKAGLCPRKHARRIPAACPNRCTDDRDCPGNRKCCFSGCGLSCIPPDTGSRRAAGKPGACPVVLRGSVGPCLELCDTDGDCPGAAKCCTTSCGHVCKPPTEARPGLCPPVNNGDRASECLLLCLQDKDCPPGQKCCLRDCGRACVPPLRGTA